MQNIKHDFQIKFPALISESERERERERDRERERERESK